MSPKAGIVIRTFNEEAMLGRTLEAIAAQSERSFEVILVDSGSTDRTLEIARTFPGIRIIQIPKAEFTYGRALNVGIAACSPGVEYAVLLSAHAVPCHDNWLKALLGPMENNHQIIGVYGKQIPHPEHLHSVVNRFFAREVFPSFYGDQAYTSNTKIRFSNVNAAIRRSWWARIPYDETLGASEDREWCQRSIAAGGFIAYAPDACVLHSHSESIWAHYRRYKAQIVANRIIENSHPYIFKQLYDDICSLTVHYLRICRRGWAFTGTHFDRYRVQVVEAFARYMSQKEFRNEK